MTIAEQGSPDSIMASHKCTNITSWILFLGPSTLLRNWKLFLFQCQSWVLFYTIAALANVAKRSRRYKNIVNDIVL